MEKDEAKGARHEVKSDIKEMAGIATDQKDTKHEGKAEKGLGAPQRKTEDVDDDILDLPKE